MYFVKWLIELKPRPSIKVLFIGIVFIGLQFFGMVSLPEDWSKAIVLSALVSLTCMCIDIIYSIARLFNGRVSDLIDGLKREKEMKEILHSLPKELYSQLLIWAIQNIRTINLPMNQTRAADTLCEYDIIERIGSSGAFLVSYRIKEQPWKYLQKEIRVLAPWEQDEVKEAAMQYESRKRIMPWSCW